MTKIAFVFPGQGAQAVGMGQDFYESPTGQAVYETFNKMVNPKLSQICFEGPEEELRRTIYTQPAILATSLAALSLFQEHSGLKPDVVAGHSLGEYGALYAAGVISLETSAQLVKRRSELMEAASEGAMSAVLGLDSEAVERLIEAYQTQSGQILTVANYNTENQVVISGVPEAVEAITPTLKEAGAKRVLPLPVGGAFHSPLMRDAATSFTTYLNEFEFQDAQMPVITNVDALPTQEAGEIRRKLALQIDHSVRWNQTMTRMIQVEQITTVIEFGPGKVLTGMFKKSFPEIRVLNIFDLPSLAATLSALAAPSPVSA